MVPHIFAYVIYHVIYHVGNNIGYHSQGSPPHKTGRGYETDVWEQTYIYMFYT
jgi:hypothetical protein